MKTWHQVIKWDPGNYVAREWLDSHEVKKTLPKIKQKKSKKTFPQKQNDSVEISPRLATFTMVTVLRNQGLHHQALTVLDILEKKGSDKKRIKSEKQEIIKMLEE